VYVNSNIGFLLSIKLILRARALQEVEQLFLIQLYSKVLKITNQYWSCNIAVAQLQVLLSKFHQDIFTQAAGTVRKKMYSKFLLMPMGALPSLVLMHTILVTNPPF
jgi:hypothetical protein